MSKKFFESKYPNISRWVNQENGIIEIGWRDNGYSSAFVRAFETGGIFWEGEDEYESMEDALLALEGGVRELMREIHGESWESA
ncbi:MULTISPECIES: hypothetical protein [Pseudanabaena]|uniref:Uncharacterized protein n=2 Tax=Pseudanabaena TaxID=1152 RepID=L8N5F5_9CYAN|nr:MULTISPECIES: hypothetical protein [Pseudanabaena]ELS34344.1 hypothetical protein Pse7429DRAFT_0916 [Pseudanabaena biceps PCC 7429]MDG3493487.1 hypothetical protein [Pseudanabaena catenata USMAC16]